MKWRADEAGEKKLIDDVTSAIKRHEGKPPAGWLNVMTQPMISARNGTVNTVQ